MIAPLSSNDCSKMDDFISFLWYSVCCESVKAFLLSQLLSMVQWNVSPFHSLTVYSSPAYSLTTHNASTRERVCVKRVKNWMRRNNETHTVCGGAVCYGLQTFFLYNSNLFGWRIRHSVWVKSYHLNALILF